MSSTRKEDTTRDARGTMTRREALHRIGVLLGGAVSAPTVAAVLNGCQASTSESWTPRTLNADQNEMVVTIGQIIIPETDTPGAKAAHVNRFIDAMLTDWYPAEKRDSFLEGLGRVNERAKATYGTAFLDCTHEKQVSLVTEMDREAYASERRDESSEHSPTASDKETSGDRSKAAFADTLAASPEDPLPDTRSFMRTMKKLTLTGYYTSEVGATQELGVNPMGTYQGDIPYSEIGHAWA